MYKLRKALYGLKQAPRAWYKRIDSYFLQNGFVRSENEPTLYVKRSKQFGFLIVCVYVDDMIYLGSSQKLIEEFKSSMTKEFEMTDLGKLQYFLGLEVIQAKDGVFISQKKYAKDLLHRFHMHNAKPAATPMNTSEKLRHEDGTEAADASYYRSLVGGLNYLTHTRPDIMHSVSVLSRYMHSPTMQHLGAAKRVLRYIGGTIEHGIWYAQSAECKLFGFSDSDWAGCLDDRRSTSGHTFILGSGAISWSSKKQDIVALSSSEAEYVAVNSAACQMVWLRRVLSEVGYKQEQATEIFCDNKATIAMTKNPAYHSRTKHIDIRFHYIRSLVASKEVELKFCTTNDQTADILTKALSFDKHTYFRQKLGVCSFEARG